MRTFLRISLLVLIIGCWQEYGTAQIQARDTTAFRYAIKTSLAHWADPLTPGPYISFEHQTRDNVYVRYQLGYLLRLGYEDQEAIEDMHGFRIRWGLRQYDQRPTAKNDTNFWEASFDYRYLDALVGGDFSLNDGQFNQRILYDVWQHSWSFNFITGRSFGLGRGWRLDIGIGAGVRLNHRQFSTIPDGTVFDTNGNLYVWNHGSREGWHATVSVPAVFSFGYMW